MKNIILLLAFIGISSFCWAQKPGHTNTNFRLFENSRPLNLPDGMGNNLDIPIENIEGSPYYYEDFVPGKVFSQGENAGTYLMRYNVYNDVMEVKLDEGDIQELIIDHSIKIAMGENRFVVHNYNDLYNNVKPGYFEILEDGEHIDLLVKHHVTFIPGKPAKSSFHKAQEPEFDYTKDYYIYYNDDEMPAQIKKLKEKKVLEILKDKELAREIIEKNDLDLDKEDDLKKLVKELNAVEA
ncbi:hypothetical protein E0K83_16370 [Gramella sp. BOM4]|nr:hypothetical protein [Christiangramia bathymodioli]